MPQDINFGDIALLFTGPVMALQQRDACVAIVRSANAGRLLLSRVNYIIIVIIE